MPTIINPLPYVFVNGTTIDATQMDADLGQIVSNVNVLGTTAGAALVGATAATNNSGATVQAQLNNVGGVAGASNVGYTPPGTGAVTTTVGAQLANQVFVETGWNAHNDGVTDDTSAFVNAMASLGVFGGTVHFVQRHYIASNLTIPANVTIKGPFTFVGSPEETGAMPYGSMAALVLNPAATISLTVGAGIDGALIVPSGMTFPQANASAWAGTAIQTIGDCPFVIGSMILGFNKAIRNVMQSTFTGTISSTNLTVSGMGGDPIAVGQSVQGAGVASGTIILSGSGTAWVVSISQSVGPVAMTGNINQGGKFFNLKIDCNNGIEFQDPQDIAHCNNVECFPFATIGTVSKPANWADRSGTAFYAHTTYLGTGASITCYDCFSFGYLNGFTLTGTNDSILDGCWADGTGLLANSTGFQVLGNAYGGAENKLTACVATGLQNGFIINNNVGSETMLVHTTCSNNEVSHVSGINQSILVQSGDAYIIGATVRGTGPGSGYTNTAVIINSVTSRVIIDGLRSQGLNGSYPPIYNSGSSPYVFLGVNDFRDLPAGSSPVYQSVVQTVASAGTLLLPSSGQINETYTVTGAVGVGGMAGGYIGRRVTLIFGSSLVLYTGGGINGLTLIGGTNMTVPAGCTSTFVYENATVGWVQILVSGAPTPSAGNVHTVAAGSVTGVFVNTTFDGSLGSTAYTVGDIVNALKTIGAIKL